MKSEAAMEATLIQTGLVPTIEVYGQAVDRVALLVRFN